MCALAFLGTGSRDGSGIFVLLHSLLLTLSPCSSFPCVPHVPSKPL